MNFKLKMLWAISNEGSTRNEKQWKDVYLWKKRIKGF